jgi:hypothetical protein
VRGALLYVTACDSDLAPHSFRSVGIDVCYPTRYYSFINGNYLLANELLVDFITTRTNECALFRNMDDAREFMALHVALQERLGLE